MISSVAMDIHAVSNAIRDAVAPVFLLTGIGSILGVLIGRLGRSIDRARQLETMRRENKQDFTDELSIIIRRIKWLRRAIALATLAALCVCISIVMLFLTVETGFKSPHTVMIAFIASMCAVIAALMCFLREIILASSEVIVSLGKNEK